MKKKKIIIIAVIAVILIIAAIVGMLFFKTDLLKSNETLFYNYLLNTQVIEPEISQRYQKMAENIRTSNYSSNGNISCSMSADDNITNIANIQNLFNVKYNMLANKSLNQAYADFTVSSNNQNIITIKYLKDSNIYGLKVDNIVNKYLALENTNLKEFFTKLGVKDVSKIPNSIPQVNLEELLSIDQETLSSIKTTYGNVIIEKLDSNNFTKITNSNKTVTIELSLTEQEVADIEKALLETLKNDDNTINLIIDKAKILGYELNIDSMKTSIQEQIDEIVNGTYSTDASFLKLAVTEDGKNTIKLDFQILVDNNKESNQVGSKSQVSYSMDLSESNKVTIFFNDGKENNFKEDIIFGYEENSILTNIEIFNLDEAGNVKNSVGKIQYQINNYETSDIIQNTVITISSEDNTTLQLNMDNEIQLKQDVQIEKISSENAEILNNKSSAELSDLFTRIFQRFEYVYGNNYMSSIIKNSPATISQYY